MLNGAAEQNAIQPYGDRSPRVHLDRRRSVRVSLGLGLPARLDGLGPTRLIQLSLGGVNLESERRIPQGEQFGLIIDYNGTSTYTEVEIQSSILQELIYVPNQASRVRYDLRGVFLDPSVATLNLVYRILNDYWTQAEGLASPG